jgi:hypothetical protein
MPSIKIENKFLLSNNESSDFSMVNADYEEDWEKTLDD